MYLELMDSMNCPWMQSRLPASLACQDLAYWLSNVMDSLPRIELPGSCSGGSGSGCSSSSRRLPQSTADQMLGEPTKDEEEASKAIGYWLDGRPIVEPMALKKQMQDAQDEPVD